MILMGQSRSVQKQETIAAVAEAMMLGLRESEALSFIEEKLGRSIHHSHYCRVKKFLESDDSNHLWLNNHARSGFIFRLRNRLWMTDKQIESILRQILEEQSRSDTGLDQNRKTVTRRDVSYLLALRRELRAQIELQHELDMAIPIAAKIKAMLLARDKLPRDMSSGKVAIDEKMLEQLWKVAREGVY